MVLAPQYSERSVIADMKLKLIIIVACTYVRPAVALCGNMLVVVLVVICCCCCCCCCCYRLQWGFTSPGPGPYSGAGGDDEEMVITRLCRHYKLVRLAICMVVNWPDKLSHYTAGKLQEGPQVALSCSPDPSLPPLPLHLLTPRTEATFQWSHP